MKKFKSILVLLMMAIIIIRMPVAASAATESEFQYNVSSDGSAEISLYTGTGETIQIPSMIDGHVVKRINELAFLNKADYNGKNYFTKKLYIPDSIEFIGNSNAEWKCLNRLASLSDIEVAPENKSYSSKDGVLFNKDKSRLISYPQLKLDQRYEVPESVKIVGHTAFMPQSLKELKFSTMNPIKVVEGPGLMASFIEKLVYPKVETFEGNLVSFCPMLKDVFLSSVIDKIPEDEFYQIPSDCKFYVYSGTYAYSWVQSHKKQYVLLDSKITDPTSQIEVESVPEDSTLKVLNDGNQFEISFSSAFAEELGNVKLSIPMPERALVWKGTEPVGSQYDGKNVIITEKADEISGQYSFTTPIWGDVLEDGLTLKDAAYIQGSVSEKKDLTTKQNLVADCNGDGKITMKDVSDIQIATLGD